MTKIDKNVSKYWDDKERINLLVDECNRLIDKRMPYIWGGDNPEQGGMDCSGSIQYILRPLGLYDAIDRTAQGIYLKMVDWNYSRMEGGLSSCEEILAKNAGICVFYGKSTSKITHIAITIGKGMLFEAGGGGRFTTSEKAAIKANAFVRKMGVWCRRDVVAIVDPFNRGLFV